MEVQDIVHINKNSNLLKVTDEFLFIIFFISIKLYNKSNIFCYNPLMFYYRFIKFINLIQI